MRCRKCCDQGYLEWPEPIRSGGHVRILSATERRAWRADELCPGDANLIWTLSPLIAAVEVRVHSLEHSICLGSRWKLNRESTMPEILAEDCAKNNLWREFTLIVEQHESALNHILALFALKPYLAMIRLQGRDIAQAIRARRQAQAIIDSI
jgi:hypothetical protein